MTKKLQPKLRFKGFTDDWEQRSLGTAFEESEEIASDREILSVTVANGIYPARNGDKEANPGASLSKYKVVHANDIVYNSMRLWQGAVGVSIYEGIVSPAYVVCRSTNHSDPLFYFYLLKCPENLQKFYMYSQGNSKDTLSLKYEAFSKIKVKVPTTLTEQAKIARLFSVLDQCITAEQRKLSLLEDKKNAYLQELFSEAFIDQHSWNVTQLEDVASLIKRKNKEQEITCVYTNSAEYGIVPQAQFFDRDIASREHLENYTIIEQDDFIYNPRISKEAPYGPIRRNKNASIGVVSPLYTVFRLKSIDPTFMEYFFQSNVWHKFMQLNGDTGARSDRFAIKDSVFLRMPIAYPTNDAQKRIGAFFQQLDTLIKTEKHKIQLLQQKKKGLLQQMFI